jgi:hypothetical protein
LFIIARRLPLNGESGGRAGRASRDVDVNVSFAGAGARDSWRGQLRLACGPNRRTTEKHCRYGKHSKPKHREGKLLAFSGFDHSLHDFFSSSEPA